MNSEHSKNGETINYQAIVRLHQKLSRLHLEMASAYTELATPKPLVRNGEKVVLIKSKSGKQLANLRFGSSQAKVEMANWLPTDNAPYAWLKNHLKSIAEKNGAFRFRLGEEDQVLKFVEIEGNINSALVRELGSALRWAFSRMDADYSSVSNQPSPSCQGNRTKTQECVSRTEESGPSG